MKKKHLAILGSTGSIGTQALDIISRTPELYEVELLTANNNYTLLIEQAIKFNANSVVICNDTHYTKVKEALEPHYIKVFSGIDSIVDLLTSDTNINIVLTAMVGFSGVRPTIAAIKSGKTIALANKETLVAAGSIITSLVAEKKTAIIPVDSEHSAIFQCLQGEHSPIKNIHLTASGGPFFKTDIETMRNATKKEALAHPNWTMGAKVTIDSATMMNKGLEMIEAKWLFGVDPKQINIVVHPQSIIHSMVEFGDGSTIAQLSLPDMRIPIQYALTYPLRVDLDIPKLNFFQLGSMNFYEADRNKFPCLDLAFHSINQGGNTPCIMNAANEVAVKAFLEDRIKFYQIPQIIEKTIQSSTFISNPNIDDIFSTDFESRNLAKQYI